MTFGATFNVEFNPGSCWLLHKLSMKEVQARLFDYSHLVWSLTCPNTVLTFGAPSLLGLVAVQADNKATFLTDPVDVEERRLAGITHLPHPPYCSLPRQLGLKNTKQVYLKAIKVVS